MSAVKTIIDPIKGSYDVLVSSTTNTLGTITSGSALVVSNVVSGVAGGMIFPLSSSATTVKLPVIAVSNVGTAFKVLADTTALTISASNSITSPGSAFTVALAAYSASNYVAVSGTLGYYWHVNV